MSKSQKYAVEIPIKECAQFLEDPQFAAVKATLSPAWTTAHCYCCSDDEPSDSNNMDNVTFHNDRFEVVVNVKGYEPQEIRCNVTPDMIQLLAQHEGSAPNGQGGVVQRNMSMDRSYQLPQRVNPELATCYLSSDGILVITAPWGIK